jgi:hypothetical protein
MTRLELLRARLQSERETIMSHTTRATVATTNASRYLQQLCKHWAHKLEVAFDPLHGTIRFPSGAVATLEAGEEALTARIDAPDVETLDRMKTVVAEHLDRFAFREAPLPFAWS